MSVRKFVGTLIIDGYGWQIETGVIIESEWVAPQITAEIVASLPDAWAARPWRATDLIAATLTVGYSDTYDVATYKLLVRRAEIDLVERRASFSLASSDLIFERPIVDTILPPFMPGATMADCLSFYRSAQEADLLAVVPSVIDESSGTVLPPDLDVSALTVTTPATGASWLEAVAQQTNTRVLVTRDGDWLVVDRDLDQLPPTFADFEWLSAYAVAADIDALLPDPAVAADIDALLPVRSDIESVVLTSTLDGWANSVSGLIEETTEGAVPPGPFVLSDPDVVTGSTPGGRWTYAITVGSRDDYSVSWPAEWETRVATVLARLSEAGNTMEVQAVASSDATPGAWARVKLREVDVTWQVEGLTTYIETARQLATLRSRTGDIE